ncbi:hypothetical protein C0Q70_21140 [Pomacea canaliculata]|uniref:Uncharacterized protein n=1 Tax=Pomacea canaliculata TaxID=400727 RepID=A0A2T7NBN6_POMCA|nr:hypothetical protein C0Q70_21140 [Pomacea canaliculata]
MSGTKGGGLASVDASVFNDVNIHTAAGRALQHASASLKSSQDRTLPLREPTPPLPKLPPFEFPCLPPPVSSSLSPQYPPESFLVTPACSKNKALLNFPATHHLSPDPLLRSSTGWAAAISRRPLTACRGHCRVIAGVIAHLIKSPAPD